MQNNKFSGAPAKYLKLHKKNGNTKLNLFSLKSLCRVHVQHHNTFAMVAAHHCRYLHYR